MATHSLNSYRKRKMKRRLCGEQNWRCAYCGCSLEYADATLDHVVPVHAGKSDAWLNLVVACWPCNATKGGEMSEARRQIPGMGE